MSNLLVSGVFVSLIILSVMIAHLPSRHIIIRIPRNRTYVRFRLGGYAHAASLPTLSWGSRLKESLRPESFPGYLGEECADGVSDSGPTNCRVNFILIPRLGTKELHALLKLIHINANDRQTKKILAELAKSEDAIISRCIKCKPTAFSVFFNYVMLFWFVLWVATHFNTQLAFRFHTRCEDT